MIPNRGGAEEEGGGTIPILCFAPPFQAWGRSSLPQHLFDELFRSSPKHMLQHITPRCYCISYLLSYSLPKHGRGKMASVHTLSRVSILGLDPNRLQTADPTPAHVSKLGFGASLRARSSGALAIWLWPRYVLSLLAAIKGIFFRLRLASFVTELSVHHHHHH